MRTLSNLLVTICVGLFGIVLGRAISLFTWGVVSGLNQGEDKQAHNFCLKDLGRFQDFGFLRLFRKAANEGDNSRSIFSTDMLTEIVTASLTLALFVKFSLSLTFFAYLFFFAGLIAIFRIDHATMRIPDLVSLPWMVSGFAASSIGLLPNVSWKDSLAGIVLGLVILYVPAKIYESLKRTQGLGGGDVKLLGMIGAFTASTGVIFTLFIGALTGYLVAGALIFLRRLKDSDPIPFGPYLVSAAILYSLAGTEITKKLFELKLLF